MTWSWSRRTQAAVVWPVAGDPVSRTDSPVAADWTERDPRSMGSPVFRERFCRRYPSSCGWSRRRSLCRRRTGCTHCRRTYCRGFLRDASLASRHTSWSCHTRATCTMKSPGTGRPDAMLQPRAVSRSSRVCRGSATESLAEGVGGGDAVGSDSIRTLWLAASCDALVPNPDSIVMTPLGLASRSCGACVGAA